jgi:predicted nucleotidyltransferase
VARKTLMTTPISEPHAALLDRIVAALRCDDRLEAVLASGSLVNGEFDEYSDLDLVVLVRPDVFVATMSERRAIAESIGGLLAAFTGEHVGEPRVLICLYGPPLVHVDFKFVRLEDMQILVERPRLLWAREPSKVQECLEVAAVAWPNRSPQWFEDRAWVWLHYCATKLLRGELYEALGMLAFFREQILGPMFHRKSGRWQRGVRRIEQDADATAALTETVAALDRAAAMRALDRSIGLYIELRQDDPPPAMTSHMPKALRDYIKDAFSR